MSVTKGRRSEGNKTMPTSLTNKDDKVKNDGRGGGCKKMSSKVANIWQNLFCGRNDPAAEKIPNYDQRDSVNCETQAQGSVIPTPVSSTAISVTRKVMEKKTETAEVKNPVLLSPHLPPLVSLIRHHTQLKYL